MTALSSCLLSSSSPVSHRVSDSSVKDTLSVPPLHTDIVPYSMYIVLVLVMHLSVYTINHNESRFNVN